jgi:hypothetical protein
MPSREDVAAGAPSAEQVAVMPDAPGMMVPATLGEEPSVDTVGGAGLMSRRLDQKPVTKHSGPFEDSAKGKDEFLKAIIPVAKEVGNDIGLDWRLIVAQGAIESGWGSTVKGNAFMGVKAHGAKDTVTFGTQEVIDGKRISMDDSFRAYDSLESAVRDYGKFLQSNPRYKDYLKANTLEDATKALQASKYATAPNYGESVLVTAKGRTLNSFLERNPEYKDVTETITREDTTLDQSPRPMARPEAKAVVEAKLDTATTVPEVTAAVTEAAVSTMPKEEAAKLLTNPVQWVYENNLVGLNEDTELGADAIDGFFRTATPKGIDALQRDAQGRISSTNNSWCAVFIDHVLRGIGANAVDPKTAPRGSKEPGQRKYSAMRAFEYGNYGDSVKTADAKAGDLVILSRSHIGIYTGKKDAKGRMLVLGGNQSTKTSKGRGVSVNVAAYDVGGIKSIRRISNIDDLPTDTLKALTKDMTGTAAGTR